VDSIYEWPEYSTFLTRADVIGNLKVSDDANFELAEVELIVQVGGLPYKAYASVGDDGMLILKLKKLETPKYFSQASKARRIKDSANGVSPSDLPLEVQPIVGDDGATTDDTKEVVMDHALDAIEASDFSSFQSLIDEILLAANLPDGEVRKSVAGLLNELRVSYGEKPL